MTKAPLQAIPADIVSVADYERRAIGHIDATAWAYLQGGAADERTLHDNLDAWADYKLLPRVLADVRGGHTRCSLLGETLAHPIILAPVASQCLFHPEGELATTLAASVMQGAAVISTQASHTLEEIASHNQSLGQGLLWFQLYWQGSRDATLALVKRAEAAGYRALMLTVDAPVSGARNREQRAGFRLPAEMANRNVPPTPLPVVPDGSSMVFDGLMTIALTWEDVAWLVRQTASPILLKGILHSDDAKKAVDIGVSGVVVSNHGGRVLDDVTTTSQALPEVVKAINSQVPVLVDGGIRRGTDILKARALGATAVMIGRPYIYALSVAGALGVAHLIRLLREELEIAMALSGCKTLDDIHRDLLRNKQSAFTTPI